MTVAGIDVGKANLDAAVDGQAGVKRVRPERIASRTASLTCQTY